jgi:hypothetical protein
MLQLFQTNKRCYQGPGSPAPKFEPAGWHWLSFPAILPARVAARRFTGAELPNSVNGR